jgi:molybdopterin-guanine dinucleotide biosynthesis protein A
MGVLREAGAGEIIVATGAGRSYGFPETIEVTDTRPDGGPPAGIVAGFNAAAHDRILVLVVDLPQITAGFLRGLVDQSTKSRGVVPVRDGLAEPLAAVYPRTARGALISYPLGRRKLKRRWGVVYLHGRRLPLAGKRSSASAVPSQKAMVCDRRLPMAGK